MALLTRLLAQRLHKLTGYVLLSRSEKLARVEVYLYLQKFWTAVALSHRRDQMEALFLNPLQRLRPRLSECPPVMFVMPVDALDECTSETETADLISLLARWGQNVVNLCLNLKFKPPNNI